MIAKIGRITLRTFIVILVFLIIIVLILARLVEFRMDDAGLNAFFLEKNWRPHFIFFHPKGRRADYWKEAISQKPRPYLFTRSPASMTAGNAIRRLADR